MMDSLFNTPEIGTYDPNKAQRIAEGAVLREEGIERAGDAASVTFTHNARNALRKAAETHEEFTTDEVVPLCTITPEEPRAWGAIMVWAVSEDLIENTNTVRKSTQPQNHRRNVAAWRSLVYKGGAE